MSVLFLIPMPENPWLGRSCNLSGLLYLINELDLRYVLALK